MPDEPTDHEHLALPGRRIRDGDVTVVRVSDRIPIHHRQSVATRAPERVPAGPDQGITLRSRKRLYRPHGSLVVTVGTPTALGLPTKNWGTRSHDGGEMSV